MEHALEIEMGLRFCQHSKDMDLFTFSDIRITA